MTSPKKLKVEVEGFIHEVSDVKEGASRKKYFTAVMQEAKKHTKMVIFSPQRHNWFNCAEKDESPVKVENIILSPSRQKQGDHDILVNDKSRLTCVRDLAFVFDKKPYSDVHLRTLSDILADPREHQRVNVVVKIMEEREKGSSVTRSNKMMNRTSYAISDKTASILITIWGDDTLRIDKCRPANLYAFCVAVTHFELKLR
ncbi:uncharacterized protein LOC127640931 [Xyrauchen texanus]|uniref:uncharacterized protein LOC127640931 n=1 Tax=Xyrauchen texanus TaxID=154827 RepID=UPI002241D0FE|nr:uncharacterized protein LOC127640931 [Xyrauchen texanus]